MRLLDENGRLFERISIVDLAVLLFAALLVGPAAYFAWEIRSAAPYISHVEPIETIISADEDVPLVVHGKWFNSQSVARLGDTPLITAAASSRRLDLLIPTQKISPGAYPLTVTNMRGLSAQWKEPVRLLAVPPRITKVSQIPTGNNEEIKVIILGEHFHQKSAVLVGDWPLKVMRADFTRLEASGTLPSTVMPGVYPIRVVNSYGQSDQRENAVSFSRPLPAATSAPLPDQKPPAPELSSENRLSLVAVEVLCSFEEPEARIKRKLLKSGMTMHVQNNTLRIAKIQKILRKISIPGSDRRLVLATLVLLCRRDTSSKNPIFLYGWGLRGYPPEGTPVQRGNQLPFQFRSLDIEGTVLMKPAALKGKPEKYLGS